MNNNYKNFTELFKHVSIPEQFEQHRTIIKNSQHVIERLIARQNIVIKRVFRVGPCYFVCRGQLNNRIVTLKICLFPKSIDNYTHERFSREILFLRFLASSRYTILKKSTPRLITSHLGHRAWYIREFANGTPQNINGDIRFKNSFFSSYTLNFIVRFFSELQRIRYAELPRSFQNLLVPPNFKKYYLDAIYSRWDEIERALGIKVGKKIMKRLDEAGMVYDTASFVLTYHEPYAPHFFKQNNGFLIIDWETLNLGTIVRDIAIIWMRASSAPLWQRQLKERFKKEKNDPLFDYLWETEVLTLSILNILGYSSYPNKADFKELLLFSKKCVNDITRSPSIKKVR